MKWFVAIAFVCTTSWAFATALDSEYDVQAAQLQQQLESGQIGELAHAKAMMALSERLFPNDHNLLSLRNYKVFIAGRYERGDIKKDEYDYLWQERRIAYQASRQQAAAQQESNQQARQPVTTGHLLQGIGNAFQRTYQPQGSNCVTTQIGASLSTRCY